MEKIRLSSIFKNIEVFFHISSSWVKIRLHTENQLPGLPGSALKVSVVVVVVGQPITLSIPTRVEVELGCDKNDILSHPFCTGVQTNLKHPFKERINLTLLSLYCNHMNSSVFITIDKICNKS